MELKSFLKTHLASFKVPKDFIILDELPKGSTGKTLKRRGSATPLVKYGMLRDPNRRAA
jgi:acyl-CoA synthetase (AMP-forming)/AMP-acid ligase II